MFFNEDTERALVHRNTDRTVKHDNQPLIKPTERKIGGSNHGVTKYERKIGGSNSTKKKSNWMVHLSDYYKSAKAKDPSYSYKQAMIDAKKTYTSQK